MSVPLPSRPATSRSVAAQPLLSRHRCWLLFGLLFGLQQLALLWLYWGHGAKALAGDEVMYMDWARGLIGSAPMPEPTWLWPPLQAWFLAALFRAFGEQIIVVQIVQSLLMLGCGALLRSVWLACDGRRHAANLAAALLVLNPSTFAYAHYLWPEPLHLFLLLLALWLLTCLPWRTWLALASGAALGLALLVKSLLSPFWPAFALLFWRRGGWRTRVVAAFLLAVGVLGVTGPLLWQGWQATGKPLIADSSAFNLVGGLEDRWRSDYVDDSVGALIGVYYASAPTARERNALFMQRAVHDVERNGVTQTLGEQVSRQYFRLFSNKTLLLSQLPGPACAGFFGSYPLVAPVLSSTTQLVANMFHIATLAGFALGLVLWRRWREPLVWWTAAFFAFQLALYLLLHVKARFLLPMMPLMCGFAASFYASCSRGSVRGAAVDLGAARWRWIVAVGAMLLLLGLAFGGPLLDRSCA